ncbi:MAG TPA: ABC transporter permease [Acidimicrobiia bacterium]|nr:ABC transporter permease [Acidimicrobiia bacterium]
MTFDSLQVALKGLLANRMRSLLTMLGILIGTASVILLVAVGTGISNAVQKTIESMGSNAMYIWPEQNPGGNDKGGTATKQAKLTDQDIKALSDKDRAPSIRAVAGMLQLRATAVADGTTYALQQFVGAGPRFAEIRNAVAEKGRMIDEQDQADHAKVAVMGQTVIKKLWHKDYNPVGRDVQFNGVRFRIVGVLEKRGSNGFQDQDDVVIAPIGTVEDTMAGKVESYHFLAVQAISRQATDAAQAEMTEVLRQTHRLGPDEAPDFGIFNQAQLLTAGKAAALLFSLLLGAVAAIALFIGGIGVMNIMLVTVTERTREIGIRKALGAQRSDILSQFLTEAVLLSLIGGAMGVAIGIGLAQLQLGPLELVVSFGSIVLSFGVSALVGVFFGFYPANRAARLTPIEALRYE